MAFKSKSGNVLSQTQIGITQPTAGATYVSDCNSATYPNVEYYTNMSTQNKPGDNVSTWQVWAHQVNANSVVQFATSKSTNSALYMRQFNGTWGDWVVVARPLDVYPIGSIYKSNTSTNPAQYFGGTWQQIASTDAVVVSGSHETDPQSRNYSLLFSLQQVKDLFNSQYGIDPDEINQTNVVVSVTGTAWSEANIAPIGSFYNADGSYYAFLSGSTATPITITWTITYQREQYTFVRTA